MKNFTHPISYSETEESAKEIVWDKKYPHQQHFILDNFKLSNYFIV